MSDDLSNRGEKRKLHRAGYPDTPPISMLAGTALDQKFDSFLFTTAGPDHLFLLGLGKGLLDFVFSSLPKPLRIVLEYNLLMALRASGYSKPEKILKSGAKAKDPTTGLGVSETAACLVVLLPVLSSMREEIRNSSMPEGGFEAITRTASLLMDILRVVYYIPRPNASTLDEAKTRYSEAQKLPSNMAAYILHLRQLCRSSLSRLAQEANKYLDRPNLHRALEFCCYWHCTHAYCVLHMGELLLEKHHQDVKNEYP